MKKEFFRYFRLIIGLFLCSLGIIVIIKADLGFSPWDVFHQGLSLVSPLTIGQASIVVGVSIVTMDIYLGERIGSGTILNTVFIGTFMDLILYLDFVPTTEYISTKIAMIFIGIMIFSLGSYLYISAGLGCGPRDSLMVALTKKTNLPVGVIRNTIEILALAIGYTLGGHAGIGTILVALFTGIFIQFIFALLKFDVKEIEHRDIRKEVVSLRNYIMSKGSGR